MYLQNGWGESDDPKMAFRTQEKEDTIKQSLTVEIDISNRSLRLWLVSRRDLPGVGSLGGLKREETQQHGAISQGPKYPKRPMGCSWTFLTPMGKDRSGSRLLQQWVKT